MRGGGVMIMVKESLKSKPLLQLTNGKFQESVWCQIDLNNSSWFWGLATEALPVPVHQRTIKNFFT